MLALLLSLAAAPAGNLKPKTDIVLKRVSAEFERKPGSGWSIPGSAEWLTIDDLPKAMLAPGSSGRLLIKVAVDRDGQLTRCQGETVETAADAGTICARLPKSAKFPITYRAPGDGIEGNWLLAVDWTTAGPNGATPPPTIVTVPVAPPPIITGGSAEAKWPPTYMSRFIQIDRLPDIAQFAPKGLSGTVGVSATIVGQSQVPGCKVELSSGNPTLDEAACRFVAATKLRYSEPCVTCSTYATVPIEIRFSGSSSRTRTPTIDPAIAGKPRLLDLNPTGEDIFGLTASGWTNAKVVMRVEVSRKGWVDKCYIVRSAGNKAADDAVCRMIGRNRFLPALSVFGDPVAGQTWIPVDLQNLH